MENDSNNPQLDTTSITNGATLFHTLSTDMLSIIVKRMVSWMKMKMYMRRSSYFGSGEPMAERRNMDDSVRFLALLFSENSPFRAAAATLFSTIQLCWAFPGPGIRLGLGWLTIPPEMIEGELGRNVFSACGPYLRGLRVSADASYAKDFVDKFISHVFQYCRNIKEVSFQGYGAPLTGWGTASYFFREYAANLRKIVWSGEEDENGFPDLRKCTNLRILESCTLNTATLMSLLEACGSTLEELRISITPIGDAVEVIETIRNYCKQLSVIDILNLEVVLGIIGQESFSSLIRSYGSQLKHACTKGLDHEHLVEVVNACTNLEVSWRLRDEGSPDWQHIYDLGPRMVWICVYPLWMLTNRYARALEQCSNLRHLSLSSCFFDIRPGVTDEMIENVFSSSRFTKLEHLGIRNFTGNKRNMTLIASCTANLKSAYFGPFESGSEASAFQVIADSNRHLNEITVFNCFFSETNRTARSALDSLNTLVNIFHKCRKLSLGVSCSDDGEVKRKDLLRVCKILPFRDMVVSVQVGQVKIHYRN